MKKKKVSDIVEEIDTLGQDDEKKAVKWVQEKAEADAKEDLIKQELTKEKLKKARRKVVTYNEAILIECHARMLEMIDVMPKGYLWDAKITSKGLLVAIRDKTGKWYARGMTISSLPMYDLQGIDRLLDRALAQMEALEKEEHPSGIILP